MKHPWIESIPQKFGTPGHSPIQEVDNIHSQIEHKMRTNVVYSPVNLIRVLSNVNSKHPLVIIQMTKEKFFNFQVQSRYMNFTSVPFSKMKEIIYQKTDNFTLKFRTSFTNSDYSIVPIVKGSNQTVLPQPLVITYEIISNIYKLSDLKQMLKLMPKVDQDCYQALFARPSQMQPEKQPHLETQVSEVSALNVNPKMVSRARKIVNNLHHSSASYD